MKILLIGEYSNVHHTLRDALRRAGHEVLLVSDGDGWKDYPRDIDLRRRIEGPVGSMLLLLQLCGLLPRLRGYDVVQMINPQLLPLKPRWNQWFIGYLKRHNRKLSLGCFGDDYYVVSRMQREDFLMYTDFTAKGRTIDHALNRERIARWCCDTKRALTAFAVAQSDFLMACLYEYYKVYADEGFSAKLHYMPMPIEKVMGEEGSSALPDRKDDGEQKAVKKIRILLAVQKQRGLMKGTDQIEPLLQRLANEHPEQIDLRRIESVPFDQYCREIEQADVVVDQLYSYTPAMGALEAMRKGKVVITGGERYELEGVVYEAPVINLRPSEDEANYRILEEIVLDRNKIAQLSKDSQAYVGHYHDADRVAQKCVEIWSLTPRCNDPDGH